MISQRSIDEVLDVAVIEDIVGEYVTLKRTGTSRTGLCPFHDDKSPSFSVSPSKKIYKCFSCGKAGNVATFLMENNQIGFFDAIRELAKRYNIELEESAQDQEDYDITQKKRESLFIALNFANDFFKNELKNSDEGRQIGQSYFKERGLLSQTIDFFELGFSKKGWDNLYKEASKKGYNASVLEEAGLVKRREDGSFFDFFRERVIFPIKNISGKIVGFAGRALKSDDKGPKYLNSPDTEVYHKSNILYGLFEGKKAISTQDECLLTEGYLDVITLNQNGIENVVASSGTALTPGQIRLVSRLTKNITVLFDGDEAGIKAAKRGVDVILEGGLNVKVVSFPDGEDPDSYCKKLGGEAFKKFLDENKKDFIFFMAELFVEKSAGDPIKLVAATREILDSLAKIPDALKRSIYVQELAKIVNQEEEILLHELNKITWKKDPVKKRRTEQELEKIEKLKIETDGPVVIDEVQEKNIIRLIVQSGEKEYADGISVCQFLLNEIVEDEIEFSNSFYASIFKLVEDYELSRSNEQLGGVDEEEGSLEKLFLHNPNPKVCSFAADCLSEMVVLSPLWEKNEIKVTEPLDNYKSDVDSVLLHLKRVKIHQYLLEIQEQLKDSELSEEETIEILTELKELKEIENSLARVIGIVILK